MMNDKKTLCFEIPFDLYRRFSESKLRKECATDVAAIRTAIKQAIDNEERSSYAGNCMRKGLALKL